MLLLDSRERGLDEPGLRSWARSAGISAAQHVSRSYRYPFALVACYSQPVGVDIERLEAGDPEFTASICTPQELRALHDRLAQDGLSSSLWCSKEALSKALGDALRYDPRRLPSPLLWPGGRSGPWRALALAAPPGHVAWLCWRQRTDA